MLLKVISLLGQRFTFKSVAFLFRKPNLSKAGFLDSVGASVKEVIVF